MKNNRQRLIESAADLFHRQGYKGTSLDDILEATSVARSNFYYHFSSKRDLALDVVRHWTEVYDRELIAPALENERLSPAERLRNLYDRAADSQDPASGRMGCPLGRLATDLATGDVEVQRLLDEYFTGVRERVEALLVGTGAAAHAACSRLADLAVCVLEGGLLMSALRRDPAYLRDAGRTLVELLELTPAD